MKIIYCDKGYSSSINFVDNNNIFVGWDDTPSCCEESAYYFEDENENILNPTEFNFEDYNFDPSYFEENLYTYTGDEGGKVAFKLINSIGNIIYLFLENYHNGYYAHGFIFKDKNNNKIIEQGTI